MTFRIPCFDLLPTSAYGMYGPPYIQTTFLYGDGKRDKVSAGNSGQRLIPDT